MRAACRSFPSLELSPSWGHFNAWPLRPGQPLAIDTGTATIDEVLGEARRQGAIVVQSNHPFIPYGYLASLGAGVVPGGFNPAFDLAEINADVPYDTRCCRRSGGCGTRGIATTCRAARTCTTSGTTSPAASGPSLTSTARSRRRRYAEAVKNGHAYVSYGPLIEPAVMFGSELKVRPGAPFPLAFSAAVGDRAEAGQADRRGHRGVHAGLQRRAARSARRVQADGAGRTWYSIEVEDVAGLKAYSNPIWVDAVELPQFPARP